MSVKGIIFDLDGTLSNTLESLTISGNLALESLGLPTYDQDRYRYFVGDGADELVRRMLIASGDKNCERYDELRAAYRETFAQYADHNVTVYEGMPETLAKLKKMGLKLAVLSNKPHKQAIEVVHKLYGEGLFDHIQGKVKEIERKPSPDGAVFIMNALNLKAEDMLYVGDTSTDMKTGKSAGIYTVGVLWGFREREELEENGADVIISKPEEILELI